MNIYHNISEFNKIEHAVVTIGTFDGVHFGHQKIIQTVVERAKLANAESVILTFFPHPRMIIDPENAALKMINTIDEKAQILEKLGVDHLIITPFTRDFSNLSPDQYIKQILVDTIGTKELIIGYDHRFGKDRKGGLKELIDGGEIYGFKVQEIAEQDIDDVAVSSTKIRTALLNGDVKLASHYLGYNFSLTGSVIKGDKIGRTIGFPTANLFVEESYKLIPADGIYAVSLHLSKEDNLDSISQTYIGMAYIGQRPTINGMTRNIEVNIFDFNQEVYGQRLTMEFHEFLRADYKFPSLETMTEQLKLDKENTISYFKNNPLSL
ncbi:bifunctional riboflavin kinase/FAD synthetase [Pedobacter flavus]|uniref:Riboflavin biosynthesis protein n=1 Tax=Pedobacter flavus TaxID=3113906 RepID=A0ABU7H0Y0_9SPHI|nr:bifunctional riboflavin kinase/FAD synthetase [Pedobacter sp. VNH31]MEE1884990.1 bifunctional riboflavin kinase/FAD synthetase [Pedobacter sp. VNH31]